MKNLKTMMLATLTALQITSAVASNDPVVDQINITQDAVKVAMEEFSQGKMQVPDSQDAKIKMEKFNEAATQALLRFESSVKVKVLQSLGVLVGQYNKTVENEALRGEAKREILENLRKQMHAIAEDKSYVYREAYIELFSILPELPLFYDHDYSNSSRIYKAYHCTGPWFGAYTCDSFTYLGEFITTKSKFVKVSMKKVSVDHGVFSLAEAVGLQTLEDAKRSLLEGCFTSTCYFLTQSQFAVWQGMIESSLARGIKIQLNDGNEIEITRNISHYERLFPILGYYLNGIRTEGLINELPVEISEKRFELLTKLNDGISQNNCKKVFKQVEADLCQQTQEGCLKVSEINLLQDRFGKKASCLK